MTHARVRQTLSAYLEGDLEACELLAVERHLATCPECATECRELRATVALVRGLPDPEPPHDVASRVLARLAAAESEPRLRRWSRTLWREVGPLPLAAATAGLVVLAVVTPRSPGTPAAVATRSVPSTMAALAPDPARPAEFEAAESLGPPEPPRAVPRIPGRIREVSRGETTSVPSRPSTSLVIDGPALAPRPRLGSCREVASLTTASTPAARMCRPWLEGMTNLALDQASTFLAQVSSLPDAERDGWTVLLVRYARESGQAWRVGSRLRASGDPSGRRLAGLYLEPPARDAAR